MPYSEVLGVRTSTYKFGERNAIELIMSLLDEKTESVRTSVTKFIQLKNS